MDDDGIAGRNREVLRSSPGVSSTVIQVSPSTDTLVNGNVDQQVAREQRPDIVDAGLLNRCGSRSRRP
jgi:hypothetical protein